ncbi:amidohydrolase family protein [Ammoniphilus sp. YIM 78166]|uniref:amidohydrolase family protein n=1 Tax=Ammoniphilus sp. YIM 78166 TaxID=1644106 RepID=UPI00106FA61F|nr:amidohydrolase family protein [Ammoniphilus sp. YIM 78166]
MSNLSKVSLAHCQAIDVHAHPFTPEEFVRKLSISVIPQDIASTYISTPNQPFPGSNMWVQILIQRLARYFDIKPQIEEVVAQRNARAGDYAKYTRELFKDVKLTGIVADFGYPTPMLSKKEYGELCGARLWEVYRIEPVMVRLRQTCASYGEFQEQYRADVAQALKREGVLGLKSIIAYRSELEIGPMNEAAAAEQYAEFQLHERAKAKELRDFCLHIALEECTKAGKVMHIHTGIGDGDVILPKASPSFLLDLLRDPQYRETKVHLVHGGYPWVEEAAFIVSILPNVYMDISLQNPFSGHGVERILSQVFEFAPFDKVMYGSDAFTLPEMNWLGVHLFKECFERVLTSWIDREYMDAAMAQAIGEMVLYRNFENVYQKQLKEACV